MFLSVAGVVGFVLMSYLFDKVFPSEEDFDKADDFLHSFKKALGLINENEDESKR